MRGALLLALALLSTPAGAQQRGAGWTGQTLANCDTDLRVLSHLSGWQLQWAEALRSIEAEAADAQAAVLLSWSDAAEGIRADIAALRDGLEAGHGAPAPVVDRVIDQAKALQAQLDATPLRGHPGWRVLLTEELAPAVTAYVEFLEGSYRPRAAAGGLARNPGGGACFAQAVQTWTTLDPTADELEATGRALLDEARRELARAAEIDEADLPQLLESLRQPVRGISREDLLAVSNAAVQRAREGISGWFNAGSLPAVAIEPIAASREQHDAAGVYRRAEETVPAAYLVNLSRPDERRLMAEVIAFHETLPGHHLAFSLSGENDRFNSGFVEGWAIYSEYLADEMGLFSTPLDRIGMRAKHLWAASRLIVEPGLHVRGWSRDQAIRFMRENTALSDAEIAIEVDRYLVMPGQSLSYMLGAQRILQARERAQRALGAGFDVRAFHDVVLRAGPRPFAQLDTDVDVWIRSATR